MMLLACVFSVWMYGSMVTATPDEMNLHTAPYGEGGDDGEEETTVRRLQSLDGGVICTDNAVIGVWGAGSLNAPYESGTPCLPDSDPSGIGAVGLRPRSNPVAASTEPGCLCEGWGVYASNAAYSVEEVMGANRAVGGWFGGNLDVFFRSSDYSRALSQVTSTSGNLNVSHDYHPSSSPDAFEVTVTIKNEHPSETYDSVKYRRVMDWDIYPTYYSEYVSVYGTATTSSLIQSSDNGFASVNMKSTPSLGYRLSGTVNVDFSDSGPSDHGAGFDFQFGPLAPGESISFNTYYGVSNSESEAALALGEVGAELFSYGQQSGDPAGGTPYTFFFGFSGVGGVAVFSASPTSATPNPTSETTLNPSISPSPQPTGNPTESPSKNPTASPSRSPSISPTGNPTKSPSASPTKNPTVSPTKNPTDSPTKNPTDSPTKNPSASPTENPTKSPSASPTKNPSISPTTSPTKNPTTSPTKNPTPSPTLCMNSITAYGSYHCDSSSSSSSSSSSDSPALSAAAEEQDCEHIELDKTFPSLKGKKVKKGKDVKVPLHADNCCGNVTVGHVTFSRDADSLDLTVSVDLNNWYSLDESHVSVGGEYHRYHHVGDYFASYLFNTDNGRNAADAEISVIVCEEPHGSSSNSGSSKPSSKASGGSSGGSSHGSSHASSGSGPAGKGKGPSSD